MTTGSTIARFTITLSKSVAEPVQVAWNTKDGTAKAGVDYAEASGTAVFSPGETNKDVDVLVYGRAVGTEDRNFFLEMTPPPNAILGKSIGECIIYLDTAGNTAVIQVIVPTGPQGAKGDSAYQAWLDLGNTGTEEDFISSLKPSAEEIAEEVAPLLDVSNSPFTAEGTETLSKPDTMTGKRLARRVAYVGAAKVATVVLADGDNLITHAALSGDAVDFNSISLYPRILRGTVVISPEWNVEPGDKILIKSAVAGDVLHVCQYDVISERAVRNAVEPLVAPVGSQAFEALRRSYAEAGYNVVGTFRKGFIIVNAYDVGIDETTGKGFTGPAGTVAAGTDPASGGGIGPAAWVDQSGNILRNTINGFFKSGRWDAVKHLTESRMLVSDNAGLFWEWMGSFPKIITTEPSTADSWKCHGLCNGFDLTDSRNWVPTGATPEVTHKNLQMCLDTYKTIHLMALYDGSKALVVDSATSVTGVNRDMCGYTNIYCNRETLGSVLAPEMGGITDDYNVIADLIVKPGDNRYAAYVKLEQVSFGRAGRALYPEYNIYAPRMVGFEMRSVKGNYATIAGFSTRITFMSYFERSLMVGIQDATIFGWKFGEDSFTRTAPVGMTSNAFASCGAYGPCIGWLLQNANYSTFNSCFGEACRNRGNPSDAAFKVINPTGVAFIGCGSEALQVKSFVFKSNAAQSNRNHCSIIEYDNGYGTTYSGAWFDIDGLVDLNIVNPKLLQLNESQVIHIKTTGGCRVTISGNIPFTASTADSTEPIKFADYTVSASGKPANGEIAPNDGILFKEGVAQFKLRMMLDAMVSARNFSASAAGLEITKKGFAMIGFPQTIPAGAFGTALSKTVQSFSFGDDATVAAGGATFSSKFDFPLGLGGVSFSYQSV